MSKAEDMPDFSGAYEGRILQELIYLAQTLNALHDTHKAMSSAISFTEPKLQAHEAEFMRLLEQNLYYINREIQVQLSAINEMNKKFDGIDSTMKGEDKTLHNGDGSSDSFRYEQDI